MLWIPSVIAPIRLALTSALWTTKQHFQTYWSEVFGAPIIVYCDEQPTLARLLRFWNVRALAAGTDVRVLWMPAPSMSFPGVGERIRALCANRLQSAPDLLLLGPDDAVLARAGDTLGFAHDSGNRSSQKWSAEPRDLSKNPLTYWRGIDPRPFVLGKRRVGNRVSVPVTVTKPTTAVQINSPLTFNPSITGKLRIEIDEIPALEWPKRPAVAKLVEANADWTDGGLGMLFPPSATYRLSLAVPDPVAVVDCCLADVGWTWTLSDKGRYAQALVGSIAERQRISALHDRLVLAVVRELTSLTSKKAEQILRSTAPERVSTKNLAPAVSAIVPSLGRRWRTAGEIASAIGKAGVSVTRKAVVGALTRLLDDQLAVRAFRFRCQNCGLTTHIPLDRANDRVRCDGCSAEATLSGPNGEPEIEYGLNSLLDRAADQDCHIHLPVQDWMGDHLGVLWSVPGANVASSAGSHREVDVLAISRAELLIAEVKTRASAFTDSVISNVAALARDLSADHLVIAALDDWDHARSAEVHSLARTVVQNVTVAGLIDLAQT